MTSVLAAQGKKPFAEALPVVAAMNPHSRYAEAA
jgi:hypothetical protein